MHFLGLASEGDPKLFHRPSTVVADTGPRRVRISVPQVGRVTMHVPLPSGRETCVVRFTVSPTRAPSDVDTASTDDRQLGTHFRSFFYRPAR